MDRRADRTSHQLLVVPPRARGPLALLPAATGRPPSGGPGFPRLEGNEERQPNEVFRETFLAVFADPAARQAFCRTGQLVFDAFMGTLPSPASREPLILQELRAVATDLRQLTVYLREVVAYDEEGETGGLWERQLINQARRWADRLEEAAVEVDQAVQRVGQEGS